MEFKKFATKVNEKFNTMTNKQMFEVYVDRDEIKQEYLDAFPSGSNPIYLERTEHDCNTCRQFISIIGKAVTINDDGLLDSVWNVEGLDYPYDVVAEKMHQYITSLNISTIFLHNEPKAGKQETLQQLEDGSVKKWSHFHADIPDSLYERDLATVRSKANARIDTHRRSLNEISVETAKQVLDLIQEDLFYRCKEFEQQVQGFLELAKQYRTTERRDTFPFTTYKERGTGIRSTVIGTLLQDIQEGKGIEEAIKSFEQKVAPSNYKRPKAIVTKAMMEKAVKEIDDLGIRESLPRRHAVSSDISVNDVLFVDKSVQLADTDPLLDLVDTKPKIKDTSKATETTIDDFLENILPETKELFLLKAGVSNNKVFLSAPENKDAPNILKWNNNFAWTYDGNVTDSMITRNVKSAGGKVDGILRFSLQWNEAGLDNVDLDLHAYESNGNHIFFSEERSHVTDGELDIDVQHPGKKVAVENIVWQELVNGDYRCEVVDYTTNGTKDKFNVEIVFDGKTYTYELNNNDFVSYRTTVATVSYNNGSFSIKHLKQPINEISDGELERVKLVTLSPNHWNWQQEGNKHYMFMTDDVSTKSKIRGVFNEYLKGSLQEHRKAFELIGSKMMFDYNPNGLSGYGFSETMKKDIYLLADKRLYKVKIK